MFDISKYPLIPGLKFCRARIFDENTVYKTSFSKNEMDIPPLDKAVGGRINPEGIPYSYLTSDIETAIAEVRIWKMQK